MVRQQHFQSRRCANLRPQSCADPLGLFAAVMLRSDRALLVVRNDFNGKPNDPHSKTNTVNGIPSGRFLLINMARKIGHVNGQCGDEHPQSLDVPAEIVDVIAITADTFMNVYQKIKNLNLLFLTLSKRGSFPTCQI